MITISSHVLDTALGGPAQDLVVRLERIDDGGTPHPIAERSTNADGRVADLAGANLAPGSYRVTFETGAYHQQSGQPVFYPRVEVLFYARNVEHFHIPLLLSPFGYSTYRGT